MPLSEEFKTFVIGGLLCILQVEHGDRLMKQIHSSYKLHRAARTINVAFVVCIKMSASICRHYRNLKRI